MISTDNYKNLIDRHGALRRYLDIDSKIIELKNKEEITSDPLFWNDKKNAEKELKAISYLKQWIDQFNEISNKLEDLEVLFEFEKNGELEYSELEESYNRTLELIESLEYKNMLSNEGDDLFAVLQITAGAGGTESCDWSEMLMRMYIMWAIKRI